MCSGIDQISNADVNVAAFTRSRTDVDQMIQSRLTQQSFIQPVTWTRFQNRQTSMLNCIRLNRQTHAWQLLNDVHVYQHVSRYSISVLDSKITRNKPLFFGKTREISSLFVNACLHPLPADIHSRQCCQFSPNVIWQSWLLSSHFHLLSVCNTTVSKLNR